MTPDETLPVLAEVVGLVAKAKVLLRSVAAVPTTTPGSYGTWTNGPAMEAEGYLGSALFTLDQAVGEAKMARQ